jgi:hypothetical protein
MLENVPSLDRFFAQGGLSAPHLLKLVKQFGPASRRPHAYLATPTPLLAIEQALREGARIPRP